jgi:carboxymethylenebutenolidase
MDSRISELHDEYLHTSMGRREFMNRLVALTGSVAAAYATLALIEGKSAVADLVPENDARLSVETITYPGKGGAVISAYKARPKGTEKLPSVIVIHANRGLWQHFKDVARRVALEGYIAVAPDLLSRDGGTPTGDSRGPEGDAALERLAKIPDADIEADLVALVDFLKTYPESTGKVGAIGFCWGGGQVLSLAVNSPKLDAAVSYYGDQPERGYEKINAQILMNYAENDPRLNEGLPAFEEKMKANRKPYELYMYPGTQHAFNQDDRPDRYVKDIAELAWSRTTAFFSRHLMS